jgi:hypothetical protein
MISAKGITRIAPFQLRYEQLFSVERFLAARGFSVISEGTNKDTLLPKETWDASDLRQAFEVFDDANGRRELLQFVSGTRTEPESQRVRAFVELNGFVKDRQRFSTTFEWFVGELLVHKFQSFSSSFNVRVKDVTSPDGRDIGDYDVLSVLGDMSLLYLECKTGSCTSEHIVKAVQRSISLHCVACVVFLGGDKDQDVAGLLKGVKHPRFNSPGRLAFIERLSVSNSGVYVWFDCYLLPSIGEESGNVEERLRTVVRVIAAHRSSVFESLKPNPNEYGSMGYNYREYAL